MKLFKMFSIVLIGMISMTVLGNSTSDLEQKSKSALFQKDLAESVVVADFKFVNIETANDAVLMNERTFSGDHNKFATIEVFNLYLANPLNKLIPYREKLQLKYNLDFIHILNKLQSRISCRSNC